MNKSKSKKEVKQRLATKAEVSTLTKKQREILQLVYRFRFVTAPLIAQYSDQNYLQTVNERLNHLVMLGYLAKRHDSSYRLAHRPAEYYAKTRCMELFRQLIENYSEAELKRLYARPKASERFVKRSIALLSFFLKLRDELGEGLQYFAKPELNIDDYDYFPAPLPDGFISLASTTQRTTTEHMFIEYFDDEVSIGIHGRQISKYIKYFQDAKWPGEDDAFPKILIVCESEKMRMKAEKRVRYLFGQVDFDLIDRVVVCLL